MHSFPTKSNKMKVLTTLMVLLLTNLWLSAAIDPYDLVVMEDPTSNTIVFRSTVPLNETTEMVILDFQGRPTFQQQLVAKSYLNKRFSRNGLPDGLYTLVFQDSSGKTEVPLEISDNKVFADIVGATMVAYPLIQLRNQRMLVVNYKNESGKRVNVRLINASGQEVFSEKVEGSTIRRSYQLDQLDPGEYTVLLSSRSMKNYTAAIALE